MPKLKSHLTALLTPAPPINAFLRITVWTRYMRLRNHLQVSHAGSMLSWRQFTWRLRVMSRFLFAVGKLGVFIIDWNQLPVLTLLFAGLVSKKPNSPRRRVANKFHNLHWPDLVSFQQFFFFHSRRPQDSQKFGFQFLDKKKGTQILGWIHKKIACPFKKQFVSAVLWCFHGDLSRAFTVVLPNFISCQCTCQSCPF